MKINIEYLLMFFCFFPFVGINIGTDTQPFALIISIFILILHKKVSIKDKQYLILFIVILGILSVLSLFFIEPFFIMKRLFSYASIIIIPIAVYNTKLFNEMDKTERIIKCYILIWFIVGFYQTYFNRDFLTFLIPLSRTNEIRGVIALASEPSFYGYMSFLMFLFVLDFKTQRNHFIVLILIQVILFAQSTISLLYFFCFLCIYILFNTNGSIIKKFFDILIGIIFIILVISFILVQLKDTRISVLISGFLADPIRILQSDESVFSRVNDIIISFSRIGFPSIIGEEVLMSGFGGVFYETGIFSLLLYFPIMKAIYYSNYKLRNVLVISILICMFSAIQLSSPMFAFYLGYCYSKKNKNTKLI